MSIPKESLTTTLIISWDREHHQDASAVSAELSETCKQARLAKLKAMSAEGKTPSNLVYIIDDNNQRRFFTTREAAQEYSDWMTELANTHSLQLPQCEIEESISEVEFNVARQERSARATEPDLPDGSNPTAIGASL